MSSTTTSSITRVWDLKPGHAFRGRPITAIHGVVGLANSPVAIIDFYEGDVHSIRVSAAHSEMVQGYDAVKLRARAWVRSLGLREGDPVDIELLRAAVLSGSP